MGRASAITKRLNKALTKLNVSEWTVFKRVATSVHGDPLTGRGVQFSYVDTELNPPPVITHAYLEFSRFSNTLLSQNTLVEEGDYLLTVSATAIGVNELANKQVSFVFKSDTREEQRNVVSYSPLVIEGTIIAFKILVQPRKQ